VTAVERATALEKGLTIDNAITRFRAQNREEALTKLAAMFTAGGEARDAEAEGAVTGPPEFQPEIEAATKLIAKSQRLLQDAPAQDAQDLAELVGQLEQAVAQRRPDAIREICDQLEDVVFYLEDAS